MRKEVHHCPTYPEQSHSILRKKRSITAQHTRNNPTQSCAKKEVHHCQTYLKQSDAILCKEVHHCTTYPTGPPLHNVSRATPCLLCKQVHHYTTYPELPCVYCSNRCATTQVQRIQSNPCLLCEQVHRYAQNSIHQYDILPML